MSLAMPYWILRYGLRDRNELRLVLACLMVPGVMVTMLALYEAHAGWAILDGIEARFAGDSHLVKSATIRGGVLRASATLETAITAGFFLMLGFVAALGSRPFFRFAPVWLGTCVLLLLGLLSTQSRGDLIGLAIAVLIMLLARRKFF